MVCIASSTRFCSAPDSLPAFAPMSACERAWSGAKAARPRLVSVRWLWRPSAFDAVRSTRWRRGGLLAVRELVEHPHLAQGERALEVALVQQADLLGVEAVEAPHRRDARIEASLGHRRPLPTGCQCHVFT